MSLGLNEWVTELDGLLSHGVENSLYLLYLPTYLRSSIALLVSVLGVVCLESLMRDPSANGKLEPVLRARPHPGSGVIGSEYATAARVLRSSV